MSSRREARERTLQAIYAFELGGGDASLVINTVIGNVIEPRVMGKGLGISTLAVFVALLFWGWLFGLVGMFLAVPLTAALIAALDASPHTRPLAIMLGPELKRDQAGAAPVPAEAPLANDAATLSGTTSGEDDGSGER